MGESVVSLDQASIDGIVNGLLTGVIPYIVDATYLLMFGLTLVLGGLMGVAFWNRFHN